MKINLFYTIINKFSTLRKQLQDTDFKADMKSVPISIEPLLPEEPAVP